MANVTGTTGDDILYGTSDADTITGDTGNDKLFGFAGNDTLDGGDGSDMLDGGAGADTMTGGIGNDYYYVDDAGDIVTEASAAGTDLVFTTIDYTLPDNVERLAPVDESSTAPLTLIGNALNNEIIGNNGANVLIGGGGSLDILTGLGGDDSYIVNGTGVLINESAGGGYDTIFVNLNTSNSLHGGFDYTLFSGEPAPNGDNPELWKVNNVEQLSVYDQTTTNSVNLRGSLQNDMLTGNDGINIFEGHAGNDTMVGYGGDDRYFVGEAGDTVIEQAGGGQDIVYVGRYYPEKTTGPAPSITDYTLPDNVERLAAALVSSSNIPLAQYHLTGNALDNEISGNDAANVIAGGDGNDLLTGYGGLDNFVFTSAPGAANADHIADFSAGFGEKIELDHNVFTGMDLGTLSDSQFQRGTVNWQAQDADDRILYDISTGSIYFDPDGSGAQAPELFATVHDGLILSASDFAII
jgi:Ca2+-binding RTX toxin-like protein